MTREERLEKQPIGSLMLSMGLPTLAAQLINVLYNIIDRIYIGHIPGVGAAALTGVGLTFPIIILISAFANLVGIGGAPLAGIALGEKDHEKASSILGNGFVMLLVSAVLLTVVFFLIKKPFLYLFGASDVTYPYADKYISIYLIGTLFVQLTMGLNPYITVQGQAKISMLSVVIGALFNIVLDPLFIFAFRLGVAGAAIATVLSQLVSAAWVLHFLFRSPRATLKILPRKMRPSLRVMGSIAALGISPFIMSSTESLITVVFNHGMAKYGGDLYVGSITVLQSVMQLMSVPISGFAQGVVPIISYNFGAGNRQRVKAAYFRLLAIMLTSSLLFSGLTIVFPDVFAGLFTEDPALLALLEKSMPVFMAGMSIFGIQMACQNSFMALGQAGRSLFMALFRKVLLLAPLAMLLPIITKDVTSIYWAEPIADGASATVCGILFLTGFKSILDKRDRLLAEKKA